MHKLLENYLSEVAGHLGPMPTKRRSEELREMRAHLENAVLVSRELGQTEDEAAQNITAQFGTPQELGQSTAAAWRRGVAQDKRSFLGAAACTVVLTALFMHLTPAPLPYFLPSHSNGGTQLPFSFWLWTEWVLWWTPAFLLVGAMVGFLFPKRSVAGVVLGLDAYLMYFLMGGSISVLTGSARGIWHQSGPDNFGTLQTGFGVGIALFLVAAMAAWASSRWKQKRGRRIQA
jgi:uncharacterized membrane protein